RSASPAPSRWSIAAPTAFASAICGVSAPAPSIRPSAISRPPSSTTATVTRMSSCPALACAPAMSFRASTNVTGIRLKSRMDLSGRVAIVTGGGTGIGRATSIRLAKSGVKAVVINYSRSAGDAEKTAEELRALGAEAVQYRADVSDESMVKAMVGSTVERYGRLDVLVNNAGTTHFIPHPDLDALTDEVWNDILSVNLLGTFFCCRAAAPELKKAGGAIVNVASIAAQRASGSSIAYAVSKAAVVQ